MRDIVSLVAEQLDDPSPARPGRMGPIREAGRRANGMPEGADTAAPA
jgi:hypothetical protein